MRFERIKVVKLGALDAFAVDFSSLGGTITAVTGKNGAGKSTLLELLLGAIYRQCPTRGSLVELATARGASVEVGVALGARAFTIRQMVDAVSRKSESVILGAQGAPLVDSTKVSDVDAFIGEHFPSLDEVLVSTFAAQESGGFLAAKPADRKSVLLRILGIGRIEDLALAARERQRQAASAQAVAADRHERAAAVLSQQAAEIRLLEEEKALKASLIVEQVLREAALLDGERQNIRAAASAEALDRWVKQHGAAKEAIDRLEAALTDIDNRAVNNRKLLDEAAAIRAAAAEYEGLSAKMSRLREEKGKAEAELESRGKATLEAAKRTRELHAQRDSLRSRLARAAAAKTAEAHVPAAAAATAASCAAESSAMDRLREIEGRQISDAADRIVDLRVGLAAIKHSSLHEAAVDIATKTLDRDTAAEQAAKRQPQEAIDAAGQLGEATRLRAQAQAEERSLRERAHGAADHDALETELQAIEEKIGEADRAAYEGVDRADRLAIAIAELRAQVEETDAAAARAAVAARRVGQLDAAEARLSELGVRRDETVRSLDAAAAALADLGSPPEAIPYVNVDQLKRAVAEIREAIEERDQAIAEKRVSVESAEKAKPEVERLAAARAQADRDAAEWARLAKDLGKDGLQAALIDAALPEITTLANDLLHTAFGPRFTVEIRSQAADSKGKRLLETLDVVVLDSQTGRESTSETYSGGERAILAEGISLALTTLAVRAAGMTRPTIIRDEAGAALSPENARAWIAMLRRAADMIGADRVLFVSHDPQCQELADSRIEL